jgi:nitrogenase molybdenum-iron protein alpha/beta subunit
MSESRIEAPQGRYGIHFGYPRILGAYLAVNAVPDVRMLVDAPDCGTIRAEIIHDNHDWNSTLIDLGGRHRIANSAVSPDLIALDRTESLAAQMEAIGKEEGSFLLAYPSPMSALVGVDYETIYAAVKERTRLKILPIRPVQSLGDWVSGYCQVMETLARNVPLDKVPTRDDSVAVVGYLFDRNEADHQANVAELSRLLALLDLDLASVWLSGRSTGDLAAVARAGTIVALPGGLPTARRLSDRTGAKVISLPLPVGLEATCRWLEGLAEATGRGEGSLEAVAREAAGHYKSLSKAVVRYFANRDFMVCTESHLAVAVARMLQEMGGRVQLLATSGQPPDPPADLAGKALHHPETRVLGAAIREVVDNASLLPVLIGNEQAFNIEALPIAGVFLGFQSPGSHHLYDAPFLGFRGALCLVDKIVNSLPIGWCLHR